METNTRMLAKSLFSAISDGNLDKVKQLVSQDSDVINFTLNDHHALYYAIKKDITLSQNT